jgi:serine-type D-Ala-D-Ala carboxypeptidase/endopeptidase (penicillin-binding protein 4)
MRLALLSASTLACLSSGFSPAHALAARDPLPLPSNPALQLAATGDIQIGEQLPPALPAALPAALPSQLPSVGKPSSPAPGPTAQPVNPQAANASVPGVPIAKSPAGSQAPDQGLEVSTLPVNAQMGLPQRPVTPLPVRPETIILPTRSRSPLPPVPLRFPSTPQPTTPQPGAKPPLRALGVNRFGSGLCPNTMASAIDGIVYSSPLRNASWGILIQPVNQAAPLYQHNPNTALIPASNIKLFTTAAALLNPSLQQTPQAAAALERRVMIVNRNSDNDLADALLSANGGRPVVKRTLANFGVDPNGYYQVDGSGLSRGNRATPATLVSLLKAMKQTSTSDLFYTSLPTAGVDGTLRNRFRNTLAEGRVHAKTGTLTGVRALSGYIENSDYGLMAFSIVVNQPGQSGDVLVSAIDRIVLQATQVSRCS